MTSVSAGHSILTPPQQVGSGLEKGNTFIESTAYFDCAVFGRYTMEYNALQQTQQAHENQSVEDLYITKLFGGGGGGVK